MYIWFGNLNSWKSEDFPFIVSLPILKRKFEVTKGKSHTLSVYVCVYVCMSVISRLARGAYPNCSSRNQTPPLPPSPTAPLASPRFASCCLLPRLISLDALRCLVWLPSVVAVVVAVDVTVVVAAARLSGFVVAACVRLPCALLATVHQLAASLVACFALHFHGNQNRQTVRQRDEQRGRQTKRERDRQTKRQTDCRTDRQTKMFSNVKDTINYKRLSRRLVTLSSLCGS